MNNNFKTARIPVASHGLHKHQVNVPRVFTTNFFEHLPVYVFDYEKGDRINQVYSFFNRLGSLPVPALVTGRTKIQGYFVPFRTFYKGYQAMRNRVAHNFGDGTSAIPSTGRYIVMGELSKQFVNSVNLVASGSSSNYDIVYMDSNNVLSYYVFSPFGAAVYKIFCALGMPLSFYENDDRRLNVHYVLAYLRVMYDHFFPLQYVGNQFSQDIMECFNDDTVAGLHVDETKLLDYVGHLMYGYFDSNWIESCWDKPVGPNVGNLGGIVLKDPTNNNVAPLKVTNDGSAAGSPSGRPSNGTPYVGGSNTGASVSGAITQWVVDALQAVNNFIRRHGLSGNRLIENFLSNRGVSLPSEDYPVSYRLDDYSVPFEITPVENNAEVAPDTLGDLAGRGETSGSNFKFRHTFKEDGIFIILQAAVPDSEPLLATLPYNLCVDALDFHDSTFEKLGVEAVPASLLYQDTSGHHNSVVNGQVFGFIKRFFYGNVDLPLEFGDFRVISRGSQSLSQYHTFRSLYPYIANNNYNVAHSYDFLRVSNDASQFSRIFYSSKADHMTVVARIKGSRWTKFLPFGDSFDWDDDEMNQKVTVNTSGNDSSKV